MELCRYCSPKKRKEKTVLKIVVYHESSFCCTLWLSADNQDNEDQHQYDHRYTEQTPPIQGLQGVHSPGYEYA